MEQYSLGFESMSYLQIVKPSIKTQSSSRIASYKEFKATIIQEIEHVNRNNHFFWLISYRIETKDVRSESGRRIYDIISSKIRSSDKIGILNDGIGVILLNTDAEIAEKLALSICTYISTFMPPPFYTIFPYPTNRDDKTRPLDFFDQFDDLKTNENSVMDSNPRPVDELPGNGNGSPTFALSSSKRYSSNNTIKNAIGKFKSDGRNSQHVIMIGMNQRSMQFALDIESNPGSGYSIDGFVDNEWDGSVDCLKQGFELVASFDQFSKYMNEHVIDEVVIGLPMNSHYQEVSRIVSLCEEQGIKVRFLPSMFNLRFARLKIVNVESYALVTFDPVKLTGWKVYIKRFFDIVISAVSLLLFSPLFLVISLLIKLTSKGPIFFVQERVGLNKRKFSLYKFRTMISGAEGMMPDLESANELQGPTFKMKNDPRVTRFGKLLRKSSLDEIPQLINVLQGFMSLVGPRPLTLRDYSGFEKNWHRRRFSVRPGLTCLWQINGRNNIPFDRWMELDMEYIDKWSLWLDLKVMLKTIPAVVLGKGAG